MSLKEAVNALRSLKAELEASRRSKAELEAAHELVFEELRTAREQLACKDGAHERMKANGVRDQNNASADIPSTAPNNGDATNGSSGTRNLAADLLDARSAASGAEEKLRALDEEARGLREELAAVKARAKEDASEAEGQLQEASRGKSEAEIASEQTQERLAAAESEAERERARAEAAESEAQGAAEDAAIARKRLEHALMELEAARSTSSSAAASENAEHRDEGEAPGGRGGDVDTAAELESELRAAREAVAAGSADVSTGTLQAAPAITAVEADERQGALAKKIDRLQEELDQATRDQRETLAALEGERERCREAEAQAALAAEASSSLASEQERKLAETAGEVDSLASRLSAAEEALQRAEDALASSEASRQETETSQAAALDRANAEVERLSGALNEARLLSTADAARSAEELSSARETTEQMRAEFDAATSALKDAAASRTVELEAELRDAEDKLISSGAERSGMAKQREIDIAAAAAAAGTTAAEIQAAATEEVTAASKAREAAEEEAREAEKREVKADAAVVRLKSKIADLKAQKAGSEKALAQLEAERDEATAATAAAEASKLEAEDTLLVANQELQRLKVQVDESAAKVASTDSESNRLAVQVETLRAEAAETNREKTETIKALQEAHQAEKAHLQNKVEELETAVREGSVDDPVSTSCDDRQDGIDGRSEEESTTVGDEEADRLRAELHRAREDSAVRTAALETQLADKEREAADTKLRLYRRQSQLEIELEEVRASYDALRIEMARMDASMQDAAETPSDGRTDGRQGEQITRGATVAGKRAGDSDAPAAKDPAALGAEVGSAVGGLFKGKLWSGWGGSGGGGGEIGRGPNGEFTERDGRRQKPPAEEKGAATRPSRDGVYASERRRPENAGEANRQSINRVRDTMMAKLQETTAEEAKGKLFPSGSMDDDSEASVRGARGFDADDAASRAEDSNKGAPQDDGWAVETVEHPAPDYGLDSPVIRYLLQQWSGDPEKRKYLSLWLRCVIERRKVPEAFPSGLQLVGLAPEIKDGFLTLVVPMIRHTGGLPVLVHSRRSPPEEDDDNVSRRRKPPRQRLALWDLRVKVDLQAPESGSSNEGPHQTAEQKEELIDRAEPGARGAESSRAARRTATGEGDRTSGTRRERGR